MNALDAAKQRFEETRNKAIEAYKRNKENPNDNNNMTRYAAAWNAHMDASMDLFMLEVKQ